MSDNLELTAAITTEEPEIAAALDELRFLVFKGKQGDTGDSAYEEAVALGFEGTEAEWLASLKGDPGTPGVSPTVQTEPITGGHRITFTDAEHPQGQSIDVMNGEDGGGLTDEAKQALLACFANVAWINDDGQTYYDALYAALYPPKTLVSISAAFNQGSAVIYDTDSLDTLKQYLVVTAHYEDSSTATVTTYTLSGTLTVGTSTITVSYGGKTTTFTCTVSESHSSDMDGWTDGEAYTNLTIVQGEYVKGTTGEILQYATWNRTGYVPCDGCSTITFPALPQNDSLLNRKAVSNWFYDANHNPVSASGVNPTFAQGGIYLNTDAETTVNVPSNAAFFVLSSTANALATCVNSGIVPHA